MTVIPDDHVAVVASDLGAAMASAKKKAADAVSAAGATTLEETTLEATISLRIVQATMATASVERKKRNHRGAGGGGVAARGNA